MFGVVQQVFPVILGQAGIGMATWPLWKILITIIMCAAAIAIMFIALRKFGITFPDWAVQMFVICLVAAVACAAIYFVFSL